MSNSVPGHDGSQAVRIRCVQLAPEIGDLRGNITRIEHEIVRAATDGSDLLVLPELATSGYGLTLEEAQAAALRADDECFARWADLLGEKLVVVVGICEDGGDVLYNSAVILVPKKLPAVYRKVHLWDTEKLLFVAGNDLPPVVEAPFGKLGVIVCYDLEFPEFPRGLALRGADVVAVPTNWPIIDRPPGEHPPEVVHGMAAARASGIAIACCDRSGTERGTRWTEGTTIIDTRGWPVGAVDQAATGDGVVVVEATVDVASGRRQISSRNHVFDDRVPHLYTV